MNDDPANHLQQIASIQKRFRLRLETGERCDVNDYLHEVKSEHREALFAELLDCLVELQRQKGQLPNASELKRNYPQFSVQIDQKLAIDEATLAPSASGPDRLGTDLIDGDETIASDAALPDQNLPDQNSSKTSSGDRIQYIGDYEIIDEIARGGMGVVYRARQSSLGRMVALKMILAGQWAGTQEIARFRSEAEAAATLDHPGIVPIFETGEHQGQYYFSMGYIEGQSLAQQIADGPLAPRRAAELMIAIGRAIAYAHGKGIVHRDLKPANVLVDTEGQPKVTDFGLAKRAGSDSDLTGTGQVLGTPAFMPPEQASGKTGEVGPLADIYSLGAILYCLLTGRPPFQAAGPMETLRQVIEKEPLPPRALVPNVPVDLETICLKCLEKDSARRYATAESFVEEVQRFLGGEPIVARPISRLERSWRWCRRRPALAGLYASAAMLLLLLSIGGPIVAGQQRRLAAEANENLKIAERNAYASSMLLAQREWQNADMKQLSGILARYRDRDDLTGFEWGFWNRRIKASLDQFLVATDYPVKKLSYTSDGKTLVALSTDSVHLVDVLSGDTRLRVQDNNWLETSAISPDGTRLVTANHDHIVRLWDAVRGRYIRDLTRLSNLIEAITFAADGEHVYLVSRDQIVVVEIETATQVRRLQAGSELMGTIQCSPDGRRLAAASWDGRLLVWSLQTGELIMQRNVLNRLNQLDTIFSLAFSPDGQHVAVACSDTTITLWNAETGERMRPFVGHTDAVSGALFSPDGRTLASISYDRKVKLWDVATGENLQTLIGHDGLLLSMAFSPDGQRLATSGRGTGIKIWDTTRHEQYRDFAGHRSGVMDLAVSADGKWLASASRDKTVRVWHASDTDRDYRKGQQKWERSDHDDQVLAVAFAPDSQRLASTSMNGSVIIWDAITGDPRMRLKGHTAATTAVCFGPDGTTLATGSEDENVMLWDAATGKCISTLGQHHASVQAVVFHPSGKWLASAADDNTIRIWELDDATQRSVMHCKEKVVDLIFSPDGNQLAAASWDNTISIWNPVTSELQMTLTGHSEPVASITFSPDGQRLASASWDRTTKVWEASSGQELLSLTAHTDNVNQVLFATDGERLFSAAEDGSILEWNARPWTNDQRQHARAMASLRGMYEQQFVKSSVLQQVRTDPLLPSPLRQRAEKLVESYPEPTAESLHAAAKKIAIQPAYYPAAYRRALKQCESAAEQLPKSGELFRTVSLLQLRLGHFPQSRAALARSDANFRDATQEVTPANLLIHALLEQRQGNPTAAQQHLLTAKHLLEQERWKNDRFENLTMALVDQTAGILPL